MSPIAGAAVQVQPQQGVSFSQADFLNAPERLDSETAWCLIDLPSLRAATGLSEGFLNIAIDGEWVVRNIPIFSAQTAPYEQFSTQLNLGVAAGTDVTQMSFDVQASADPISNFTAGTPVLFAVGTIEIAIGGAGEDDSAPLPPAADAAALDAMMPSCGAVTAHKQGQVSGAKRNIESTRQNVPNVEAARNQCVPMSVANSMQFLENTTDLEVPHPHTPGLEGESRPAGQGSLVANLGERMGRSVPDPNNRRDERAKGVWERNAIVGKLEYLVDNGLQDDVETMFWMAEFGNPALFPRSSVTVTKGDRSATASFMGSPNIPDIVNCLNNKGDVEAIYQWAGGAHAVNIVAAGILGVDSATPFRYLVESSDFNQSNDAAGTGAEGVLTSAVIAGGSGTLQMNRQDGQTRTLRFMMCQRYVGKPKTTTSLISQVSVEDPAGHACCVQPPPEQAEVTQPEGTRPRGVDGKALSAKLGGVRMKAGVSGAFVLDGNVDWLPVSGTTDGGTFSATGTATVAGFSNVETTCSGDYVPFHSGNVVTCEVGSNGALPTGQPITYTFELATQGATTTAGPAAQVAADAVEIIAFGDTLTVAAGSTYTVNGQLRIEGTLVIESGAQVDVAGIVSNYGTIHNAGDWAQVSGAELSNAGVIDSTGTMTVAGILNNSGVLTNAGLLALIDCGQLINLGALHNTSTGTLNLGAGATLSNVQGGVLENAGANSVHNSGYILNDAISTVRNLSSGNFENAAAGLIDSYGAIENSGSFSNAGSIMLFCGATVTGSISGQPAVDACEVPPTPTPTPTPAPTTTPAPTAGGGGGGGSMGSGGIAWLLLAAGVAALMRRRSAA